LIAVDTNILVYAHRQEMPLHPQALQRLTELAEDTSAWAIPVFCLGEFLRVVTHSRIFRPPSFADQALEALEGLLQSPSLRVLSPGPRYPELLADTIRKSNASGNLIFDAQIAALCREYAVTELLTADRDFSRFLPEVRTLKLDTQPPPP
jgi:uncharacterized protein